MSQGSSPITGTLGDVEVARLGWLKETTPDERKLLADTLRKHDTTTIAGLNAFAFDLAVELVTGGISPSMALAMKPFLDFIATNTWQTMSAAGHGDKAHVVVQETMFQLREKVSMRAHYTQEKRALPAPMMEADDVELREAVRERVG